MYFLIRGGSRLHRALLRARNILPHNLRKELSLSLSNSQIILGRLQAPIPPSNTRSAPSASTPNSSDIAELWVLETDGYEDDAVVSKEGQGGQGSGFLTAVLRGRAGEDGREFAD